MFKNKDNLIILVGFIIGIIISVVGAHADTQYEAGDIYYDNSNSSLMNVDVQGAVDELADKYNSVRPTKCLDGYACFDDTEILVGSYIKMTPLLDTYNIDTEKTGLKEYEPDAYNDLQDQLYPKELNLWRVISLNDDGTIDVISEKISSIVVWFCGKTGYINYVQYLRELISAYSTEYTVDFRPFGYNGQTEYITDTSKFTTTVPWACSTGESCNPVESQGGGDELYTKDYNLVKKALGNLNADVSEGKENQKNPSPNDYYISSRYYIYGSNSSSLNVRLINASDGFLLEEALSSIGNGQDSCSVSGIRPILTLKAGIHYTGLGTKENPKKIKSA